MSKALQLKNYILQLLNKLVVFDKSTLVVYLLKKCIVKFTWLDENILNNYKYHRFAITCFICWIVETCFLDKTQELQLRSEMKEIAIDYILPF